MRCNGLSPVTKNNEENHCGFYSGFFDHSGNPFLMLIVVIIYPLKAFIYYVDYLVIE